MTHSTQPLPLSHFTVHDPFWSPLQQRVRSQTLPQQEEQLRAPGRQLEALGLTWKPGDDPEPHIFWESDVAKWLEAASHVLVTHPDPALEQSVDEVIAALARAQQPDGYLNVHFTVVRPGERFTDLHDAHELYCAGHLMEAAVAHHEATGKTTLLDIMTAYADLIDRETSPGGALEGGYCGHPEIELALVRLAHATGVERYRDLALRMVDARGKQPFYFEVESERRGGPGWFGGQLPTHGDEAERARQYNQSHAPVREQREAVGHSVRAMYLYSAMVDLAVETGDDSLLAACDDLWTDTVERKMYLTGGLGTDPSIEGFSDAYLLPDVGGYAETCAAIGLVYFARRMARAHSDAGYDDVLERSLYNGVLSGASADGRTYFYDNPMSSDGSIQRHDWFSCACCPPNLARLVTEVGRLAWSVEGSTAYAHLYVGGTATLPLAEGSLRVSVISDYLTEGTVTIRVDEAPVGAELALRIPDWSSSPRVTVAGEPVEVAPASGWLRLRRDWVAGDEISLALNPQPRRVWARPQVADHTGRTALEYGPLVFCLEGVDHGGRARNVLLPRDSEVRVTRGDELAVVVLEADAVQLDEVVEPDERPSPDSVVGPGERPSPGPVVEPGERRSKPSLYSRQPPAVSPVKLRAVPYHSWCNREPGDMAVWIPEAPAGT